MQTVRFVVSTLPAALAFACATHPPSLAGIWDATVTVNGLEIPFRMEIAGDDATLEGSFFNGDEKVTSTRGRFDGDELVLEFDEYATRLEATWKDGSLASNLPQPSDPSRFTSVKDPTEPLRFSFPDLEGRLVSNTDSRFRGKVLLVNITGSWCPNCHDEAPFLAALYRQYRPQGLEIVGLSFEEAGQLENPTRLRAFIRRYQIEYPVLLAGEPRELTDKMPQATNLSSFPTTFFSGRDGLVRGVQAGFPGVASGSFHTQAKAEITHRVEQLLAEPLPEFPLD